MKKKIILILAALFLTNISFGQEREKYEQLISEAWEFYKEKSEANFRTPDLSQFILSPY